MRRALILVAAAVPLLAAAAWGGFWIATRLAPDQLRVALEARLGELLAVPVEIGEVRTALRYGPVLEARDVRTAPGAGADGPALEVETLLARLDAGELLAGRLRVDWLALDGAVLRLERDASGLRLAGAAAPEPEAAPADRPPWSHAGDGLLALGRVLRAGDLNLGRVELRRGRDRKSVV